eukprot:3511599-Amphidinium_carterae.1
MENWGCLTLVCWMVLRCATSQGRLNSQRDSLTALFKTGSSGICSCQPHRGYALVAIWGSTAAVYPN